MRCPSMSFDIPESPTYPSWSCDNPPSPAISQRVLRRCRLIAFRRARLLRCWRCCNFVSPTQSTDIVGRRAPTGWLLSGSRRDGDSSDPFCRSVILSLFKLVSSETLCPTGNEWQTFAVSKFMSTMCTGYNNDQGCRQLKLS